MLATHGMVSLSAFEWATTGMSGWVAEDLKPLNV
jgi:hypothetical protein